LNIRTNKKIERIIEGTVEPAITHTRQWTAKAVGFWGVMGFEKWVLRG
jgi:hypothetical protein